MREAGDPGCDNGGVPPTPAQRAQARRIARELAALGFALPGTLADRMTRCGRANCRCHADPPRLHGPYHQWTRKKNGKTATRILTDDQLADYQPWFDNHRRLRELIAELEELSLAIAEADPPLEPLARLPDASAATCRRTGTAASRSCGQRALNLWAATPPDPVCPGQPQT
jgi:hypothetical protein